MKHEVPHDLPLASARLATAKAFESYQAKFAEYSPTVAWVDDTHANISFGVKGIVLRGSVLVLAKSIELDLDVSFVFKLFKKKAIDVIDEEVRFWIDKAKRGELPGA